MLLTAQTTINMYEQMKLLLPFKCPKYRHFKTRELADAEEFYY